MFYFLHYITCGCCLKKEPVYRVSYNPLPNVDTNTLRSIVINKTIHDTGIPTTTTVYF